MMNEKKTKKGTIERLRKILDSNSKKDLSPEDEQYINSLIMRLQESPDEKTIQKKTTMTKSNIEADLLKPKVTIHVREEKKRIETVDYKKEIKPKETPFEKELFEVEKVEITEPRFIEVKPKVVTKQKIDIKSKETAPEEQLTEWEEIDTKTKKTEIKEDLKKLEKLPAFAQVKEAEKKEPLDWEPLEVERPSEKKEQIEFQEIPIAEEAKINQKGIPDITLDVTWKIEPFRGMKSIDEKTAILLYDNGLKNIDALKNLSLEDLIKIRGVKRKTAKKIKKEIDQIIEESVQAKQIVIDETAQGKIKKEQIQDKAFVKIEELSAPVELNEKDSEWTYTEKEKELPIVIEPGSDKEKKTGSFRKRKGTDEKIKKETSDWKTVDIDRPPEKKELIDQEQIEKNTDESEWSADYFVDDEGSKKESPESADEKIFNRKSLKSDREDFFEEETHEELKQLEKDEDVFRGIKSIDEKIAKLLKENRIDSIDALKRASIRDLTRIRGIKRKTAKKIKSEVTGLKEKTVESYTPESEKKAFFAKEDEEWGSIGEEKATTQRTKEMRGFVYKDYMLYEKEIKTKSGKKTAIRFFSKKEPEGGKSIALPDGYKVKENKKTGLPYLKKKKF